MENPEGARPVPRPSLASPAASWMCRTGALYNRSYTTGHKAFRARATVELGNVLGWDNAHDVVYAGALDVAVARAGMVFDL